MCRQCDSICKRFITVKGSQQCGNQLNPAIVHSHRAVIVRCMHSDFVTCAVINTKLLASVLQLHHSHQNRMWLQSCQPFNITLTSSSSAPFTPSKNLYCNKLKVWCVAHTLWVFWVMLLNLHVKGTARMLLWCLYSLLCKGVDGTHPVRPYKLQRVDTV